MKNNETKSDRFNKLRDLLYAPNKENLEAQSTLPYEKTYPKSDELIEMIKKRKLNVPTGVRGQLQMDEETGQIILCDNEGNPIG